MRTETVFILGAGASKPYGFPTGLELIDILSLESRAKVDHVADMSYISDLESHGEWTSPPGRATNSSRREQLNEFRRRIRDSKGMSIDAFLAESQRNGDVYTYELGKLAIACVILKSESSIDRLMSIHRDGDWYRLALHAIIRDTSGHIDLNRLWNAPISFITFNYDRSLEYYLYTVACARGLEPHAAMQRVESLRIYHVYGRAGKPTPKGRRMTHTDDESVKYGEVSRVNSAARGIRIIGENARHQLPFGLMDAINDASRVVITGFGFDPYNTHLLDMRRWMTDPSKRIVVTKMGLPVESERLLSDVDNERSSVLTTRSGPSGTVRAPCAPIEWLEDTRTIDLLWTTDVLLG